MQNEFREKNYSLPQYFLNVKKCYFRIKKKKDIRSWMNNLGEQYLFEFQYILRKLGVKINCNVNLREPNLT